MVAVGLVAAEPATAEPATAEAGWAAAEQVKAAAGWAAEATGAEAMAEEDWVVVEAAGWVVPDRPAHTQSIQAFQCTSCPSRTTHSDSTRLSWHSRCKSTEFLCFPQHILQCLPQAFESSDPTRWKE